MKAIKIRRLQCEKMQIYSRKNKQLERQVWPSLRQREGGSHSESVDRG